MKNILNLIRNLSLDNHIPDWDDLEEICDDLDITLVSEPMPHKWPGLYTTLDGSQGIMVNSLLAPPQKIIVGLHELCHSQHHPLQSRLYCGNFLRKTEHEANCFAALVLIPRRIVLSCTMNEIIADYQWPHEFVWLRKRLFENGI